MLVPVGGGGHPSSGGSAPDVGLGGVAATGGSSAAGSGGDISAAGAGGAAGDACTEAYHAGSDTVICSASYLGGRGADELLAAGLSVDGDVLLGGVFGVQSWTDEDAVLLSGASATAGWLLRFSSEGRRLLAASRLGGRVDDLEVQTGSGHIAVGGDFGAVVLDPTGTTIVRHEPLGGEAAVRISIGSSGTVAALTTSGAIWAFTGQEPASQLEVEGEVKDLAVHDATQSIVVVGARQPSETCAGRMPFLRSYAWDGTVRWRAYDHEPDPTVCDDSVGVRVVVGRDRMLYLAGEYRGPASPFFRDPLELDVPLTTPRLTRPDEYAEPPEEPSEGYGFVARFDSRGQLQLAQSIVGRDLGRPAPFRVRALAADEDGRVYLGGSMGCCMHQRNGTSLSWLEVPPYVAPENTLVILHKQFDHRPTWTTWSGGHPGGASTTALAVSDRRLVMAATFDAAEGDLTTYMPYQRWPGGALEGFFSVLPTEP